MGICLEKSKRCLFLSRPRTEVICACRKLSADKGHTHAGHKISYAPPPNVFVTDVDVSIKWWKLYVADLNILPSLMFSATVK